MPVQSPNTGRGARAQVTVAISSLRGLNMLRQDFLEKFREQGKEANGLKGSAGFPASTP